MKTIVTKEVLNVEDFEYINPFIKVSNNTLSVETEKESVEEVVEEFKNLYNIGTAECDMFEEYVENEEPKTVEEVLDLVLEAFLEEYNY